ncbi:MAG: DNA polymerase III subunit delta' [Methylomonas sp.]|nr:DNA polymerase III subunit delta' [Methylomonas sp.]PPD20575.1 MAG: DNA polymerase III subunit delta' [Methylomonas sp.]PPD25647.1 MAG: DNA polymerase III subunit delta' [Methylomonas sp.]PPD36634.1 MAG: DNA polymerase III subunit delta' [Methylomonas sp.]PPD42824.1 MAG: DNA polymerase III subunit delta' [Methylomonas sp.]
MRTNGLHPWQLDDWQRLRAYLEQDRIPQALLLTGQAGLGKRQLAECYARALLCHARTPDGQACGECQGCRLSAAHTHPDYVLVESDEPGKAIGIDRIRQLIAQLSLKPQSQACRVVIVSPADQLNTASANAFLKCLEEPGERTCFVLISATPSRLPATIRSRCQTWLCRQPDSQVLATWLKQGGFTGSIAALLRLCGGSPIQARHYAEQGIIEVHQSCFADWFGIAKGKRDVVTIAENWSKLEQPSASELMAWLIEWLVDLVKLKTAVEREPRDADYENALQDLCPRLELPRLHRYYDQALNARQLLTTQVNKQLLFEQLLIGWLQLHTR